MNPYLIVVGFSLAVCSLLLQLSKRRKPLPPGPKGSFFSGVKDKLPSTEPWKTYAAWSSEFASPVIAFRVYNRTIVVLNDHVSVKTLLDQRANLYSDRPLSWMFHETCGRRKAIFNIPSSDPRHRIYRRLLQKGLGTRATMEAWPCLKEQTVVMLNGFVDDPHRWQQHVRRHSAAVIMKHAFGYSIESLDDPFINVADECSKISGWATAPGRWLVDYYPILRFVPSFFPYTQWQKQGRIWRDALAHLSEVPHNWVKEQMALGVHEESFTSRLLAADNGKQSIIQVTPEEEDIIKWCAGGLYAGASDTMASAITSFVLLMAIHPNIQLKAQAELSSLSERYSFMDVSEVPDPVAIFQLPYLTAILKELLRYAPVGNLALPHSVTTDDEYCGFRVPKGSPIMANVWAIMHDPELYPDPFTFTPERFLDAGVGKNTNPDPRQFAYGFGKRACPGAHFAETAMLLVMSAILIRFRVGVESSIAIHIRPEFTTGITSHIKPFPIQIIPRVFSKISR
uniref:Cytochrome P450 n=1 Tax=Psilocybe cubensis TaxID=181762 RepID=A0A8H8CER6_PSICU